MRPRITLLTTGGTIAALPAEGVGYRAGLLPARQLLAALPSVDDWLDVTVESVADIGSQDVDESLWNALAQRVRALDADPQVDGVVVTHGTDTIEETAYFLHLTTLGIKPVVLTGAMRPAHALGADGPANLHSALALAAGSPAKNLGVVAVFNDTVYDAVELQKNRADGLEAFAGRNHGALARVHGRAVSVQPGHEAGNPAHKARFADCNPGAWPRVIVLYAHAGMSPEVIDAAIGTQPQGVVIAGLGSGNAPGWLWQRMAAAVEQGIAVVRASRNAAGHVDPNVEVNDTAMGFIAAGGLSPHKARILLMCALKQQIPRTAIKNLFEGI